MLTADKTVTVVAVIEWFVRCGFIAALDAVLEIKKKNSGCPCFQSRATKPVNLISLINACLPKLRNPLPQFAYS